MSKECDNVNFLYRNNSIFNFFYWTKVKFIELHKCSDILRTKRCAVLIIFDRSIEKWYTVLFLKMCVGKSPMRAVDTTDCQMFEVTCVDTDTRLSYVHLATSSNPPTISHATNRNNVIVRLTTEIYIINDTKRVLKLPIIINSLLIARFKIVKVLLLYYKNLWFVCKSKNIIQCEILC